MCESCMGRVEDSVQTPNKVQGLGIWRVALTRHVCVSWSLPGASWREELVYDVLAVSRKTPLVIELCQPKRTKLPSELYIALRV